MVRPRRMFLKCLKVMASPATIAGKYMRSRQFSFGRGTVTDILEVPRKQAKEREEFDQIGSGNFSCHFVALVGKTQNCGNYENINQRDFKKEEPAKAHELVVTKTRQCPADPHEHKD